MVTGMGVLLISTRGLSLGFGFSWCFWGISFVQVNHQTCGCIFCERVQLNSKSARRISDYVVSSCFLERILTRDVWANEAFFVFFA